MPLQKATLGRVVDKDGILQTHVDMLIFGASGAGKTFRAATAPQPIYMLGTDPTGHKAVPFPVDGIIVKQIQDIRETLKGFLEGGHGYKTLIVDGLSFIHQLYVKEIGELFYKERGAKDPDLMPIQGRMKIQNQFHNMLRSLVNLTQVENEKDRVHVIFTTLEERLKEDDTANFIIRPLIGTKAINENFPAIFSVVGYIQPVGDVDGQGKPIMDRRMFFTKIGGVQAKDRLNIFPPVADVAPRLDEYLK